MVDLEKCDGFYLTINYYCRYIYLLKWFSRSNRPFAMAREEEEGGEEEEEKKGGYFSQEIFGVAKLQINEV